jgi:MFS transporter, CP family, cyanate transporter
VVDAPRPPARPGGVWLLVGAILVAAFNLRPAVTSVGAVLRDVQAATGMSDTVAGVLTSVPVVAFGVVGLAAGRVTRRLGASWTLVVALGLLAVGLVLRVTVTDPAALLAASAVALGGIALANVLLPVAVKRWFPSRVGWATGLYSMSLAIGTAAAAALTVPVARLGGGWRAGLGVWAVPAAVGLVVWLVVARRSGDDPEPTAPLGSRSHVHRSRQAWALAVFFGVQSLAAYTAMGWLPTIYADAGVGAAAAGLYLALVMLLGAPMAIALPVLAVRRPDQRLIVVVLALCTGGAYLGLLLAPAAAPLVWAVLLGVGFGAFPLALTLIGLRAATPVGTSQLSSLAQGVGYLIAAAGPVAVGAIRDATGGWTWPLVVLIALLVPQAVAGLVAARPGHVDVAR